MSLQLTNEQRKKADKLSDLVNSLRPNIRRKRRKDRQLLETIKVARKILSHKEFWTQGAWFKIGSSGLSPTTYEGLKKHGYENDVCTVCAEGAIELAADSILEGKEAINYLNEVVWPLRGLGIRQINDHKGYHETIAAFDAGIAELEKKVK